MKITKIKLIAALIIIGLFLLISEDVAKSTEEYFFIGLSIGWIIGFIRQNRYLN